MFVQPNYTKDFLWQKLEKNCNEIYKIKSSDYLKVIATFCNSYNKKMIIIV